MGTFILDYPLLNFVYLSSRGNPRLTRPLASGILGLESLVSLPGFDKLDCPRPRARIMFLEYLGRVSAIFLLSVRSIRECFYF